MKMDMNDYFSILSNTATPWFFKRGSVEKRLYALTNIANIGRPDVIVRLIPYLKDRNSQIRIETCNTILILFKKIDKRNAFYSILKYSNITTADLDFYEQIFKRSELLTLLKVASLNQNGYVREKAVKMLSVDGNLSALPFIVYRLADWVPEIRTTAAEGIAHFKKVEYLDALIENLPLFEWLQKVERTDLNWIYNDVMHYVVVENKPSIISRFNKFPDRISVVLAKEISNNSKFELSDLRLFLSNKNFLVRILALNHFEMLSTTDIETLLRDKSSKVRLQTLYQLKPRKDFPEIVNSFLADTSASIRRFTRFELKNEGKDFAAIYYEKLVANTEILGSLAGLGETNGKQYVAVVETFLKSRSLRIRKAAFQTLRKLDRQKAYDFALQNLGCDEPGLRKLLIEFLSNCSTPEVLEKARTHFMNGKFELKKSMLRLFTSIGGWAALGDIILGTADEDELIRELSISSLSSWKQRAARLFTQPKQNQLEYARQSLELALTIHEKQRYFEENPLIGMDFYLKN